MPPRVLISAGEASGDLYAASLAQALRGRYPDIQMFGCAGPHMQAAGVQPLVDASSLAVVGLFEVLAHIPRIYAEYRKLLREIRRCPPSLAILTDSPDFHLRLAKHLKALNVPVVYLVAPQVWAWRRDRLPGMRRNIGRLLCIFPFEPEFFARHGVSATYIGHPLTRLVKPSAHPVELRRRYQPEPGAPLIALLPGSRTGEVLRHLPYLIDTAERIRASRPAEFVLAVPAGFGGRAGLTKFRERFERASIQVREGQAWDVLACADLALAASGTVTVEACLLGTPMVTFYRIAPLSWALGKLLVRVPHYCMVNLIAGRKIVPELIQWEMSGASLAAAALRLLDDENARVQMVSGLREVARKLGGAEDPMDLAAGEAARFLNEEMAHVL